MKSHIVRLFVLASIFATARAQAQSYTVTDLGVLAGDQMSTAQGLNDQGQAVGTSANENGEFGIATLFAGGKAVSLGTLGSSDDSIAEGINDSGQVTGYDFNTTESISHAFLYTGGKMVDIDDAALFSGGSDGTGINSSGQICGYGWPNTTVTHAFLYSGGKTTDLGTLGGDESVAEAIDNSGQVVGQSTAADTETHAFLYSNGKMQDLGIPTGDNASSAIAISENGLLILGELGVGSGVHVGIYSNGAWSDLGSGIEPTGINNSGQVVGWTVIPGVYSGPKSKRRPSKDIGVVSVNGTFTDLNTLIPANSGFTINMAEAVNNAGQILCNASNASDETHAVLLTPK